MANDERDAYQQGDPGPSGCKTLWLGDVQVRAVILDMAAFLYGRQH